MAETEKPEASQAEIISALTDIAGTLPLGAKVFVAIWLVLFAAVLWFVFSHSATGHPEQLYTQGILRRSLGEHMRLNSIWELLGSSAVITAIVKLIVIRKNKSALITTAKTGALWILIASGVYMFSVAKSFVDDMYQRTTAAEADVRDYQWNYLMVRQMLEMRDASAMLATDRKSNGAAVPCFISAGPDQYHGDHPKLFDNIISSLRNAGCRADVIAWADIQAGPPGIDIKWSGDAIAKEAIRRFSQSLVGFVMRVSEAPPDPHGNNVISITIQNGCPFPPQNCH